MALRGDLLQILVQQHSSGTTEAVIAETTSCSIDFSAAALETTSQTSGLNSTYIGGKVDCTISGDYLLASTGAQFTHLFAQMNGGYVVDVSVQRNGTIFLTGEGVFTSLSLGGGLSDSLATGSFSLQCSGNMAV